MLQIIYNFKKKDLHNNFVQVSLVKTPHLSRQARYLLGPACRGHAFFKLGLGGGWGGVRDKMSNALSRSLLRLFRKRERNSQSSSGVGVFSPVEAELQKSEQVEVQVQEQVEAGSSLIILFSVTHQ